MNLPGVEPAAIAARPGARARRRRPAVVDARRRGDAARRRAAAAAAPREAPPPRRHRAGPRGGRARRPRRAPPRRDRVRAAPARRAGGGAPRPALHPARLHGARGPRQDGRAAGASSAVAAPRRRRGRPEALRQLEVLARGDADARVARGARDGRARRARAGRRSSGAPALSPKAAQAALDRLGAKGGALLFDRERRSYVAGAGRARRSPQRLVAAVDAFHAEQPLAAGVGREELRGRLPPVTDARLFQRLLAQLAERGELVVEGDHVRSKGHAAASGADAGALKEKVAADAREGRAHAARGSPSCRPLVGGGAGGRAGGAEAPPRRGTRRARVAPSSGSTRPRSRALRERLVAFLRERREITTQEFKDLVGATRKHVIPLAEYFDREKVTLRVGREARAARRRGPRMTEPAPLEAVGTVIIRGGRILYASPLVAALPERGRMRSSAPIRSSSSRPRTARAPRSGTRRRLRGEPTPSDYEVALALPAGGRRAVELQRPGGRRATWSCASATSPRAPTRRPRLEALAALGAAIQRERSEAAVFARVRDGLRAIGLTVASSCAPRRTCVRVEWAAPAPAVAAAFDARARAPVIGHARRAGGRSRARRGRRAPRTPTTGARTLAAFVGEPAADGGARGGVRARPLARDRRAPRRAHRHPAATSSSSATGSTAATSPRCGSSARRSPRRSTRRASSPTSPAATRSSPRWTGSARSRATPPTSRASSRAPPGSCAPPPAATGSPSTCSTTAPASSSAPSPTAQRTRAAHGARVSLSLAARRGRARSRRARGGGRGRIPAARSWRASGSPRAPGCRSSRARGWSAS